MKRRLPLVYVAAVLAGLALNIRAGASIADVVVVVSAKSTVTALSRNQVVDIFLGKTSRFPDGSPAVPIDQVTGIATRDQFYSEVASKSGAQLRAYWSKIIFTGRGQPPREASGVVELKRLLIANASGIGYIDRDLVDDSVRIVRIE